MIFECKEPTEIELGMLYSQLLLNSKLLALIENKITEPIQIFKVLDGKLAVFNPKKNSLFFSSATDPDSALEIFIHLKSQYKLKIIEGAEELIKKIGIYLQKLCEKFSTT